MRNYETQKMGFILERMVKANGAATGNYNGSILLYFLWGAEGKDAGSGNEYF